MENKEQINLAQGTIKSLQDYIELAKVQSKIKTDEVLLSLTKQIEELKSSIAVTISILN